MTQVHLFLIDLTLRAAMVTENGRKYIGLDRENVILDQKLEVFSRFC